MTPGMQVRVWFREASRSQVAVTLTAIAAAITLIVVSIPSSSGTKRTVTSNASGDTLLSPAAGESGGAETAAGTGASSGGAAGASGGGAGGAAGARAGGARSGAAGSAGGAGAPLTASDVGVTSRTIKVGFLIASVGGLANAGFALGLRGDMPQVVNAYVDYINKNGGVNGRSIEAVQRKTDPLTQSDQSQACTNMVSDNKVFAVIDTSTVIYAATQQCFAIQNHLPYVHSYALSTGFQNQANGLDITVSRTLDRIARDWAAEAKNLGVIKGGEKVGIFTDACEPSNTVLRQVLAPGLKAAGAGSVTIGQTDCNPEAQQTQTPNVVTQFNLAHITHVFPATSYVGVQVFLQAAQSQGYHPKYFASPYDGLDLDLFTENFNPDQFDGTLAISTHYSGYAKAGKPAPAFLKFCSGILTSHGLPPLEMNDQNAEARAMCDNLFLFVTAAKKVGPNLTRAGWGQQTATLGRFDSADQSLSVFKPGKYSGSDLIQTIQWHRDCTCFTSISDFRPGIG
jgi:ABC-type branched-subunit amino acid transport system substrate-binding protein